MNRIFIFVAALLLASCGEAPDPVTIRINHYKQSSVGLFPTLVWLTQEGDDIGSDDWQYHDSAIRGFDYEWGFVYDILVNKRTVDHPPADGSSIEYTLERIVTKKRVDQDVSFNIQLKSSSRGIPALVTVGANAERELLDEQRMHCAALCELLDESLAHQDEVTGVFKHVDANTIALQEVIVE